MISQVQGTQVDPSKNDMLARYQSGVEGSGPGETEHEDSHSTPAWIDPVTLGPAGNPIPNTSSSHNITVYLK